MVFVSVYRDNNLSSDMPQQVGFDDTRFGLFAKRRRMFRIRNGRLPNYLDYIESEARIKKGIEESVVVNKLDN